MIMSRAKPKAKPTSDPTISKKRLAKLEALLGRALSAPSMARQILPATPIYTLKCRNSDYEFQAQILSDRVDIVKYKHWPCADGIFEGERLWLTANDPKDAYAFLKDAVDLNDAETKKVMEMLNKGLTCDS